MSPADSGRLTRRFSAVITSLPGMPASASSIFAGLRAAFWILFLLAVGPWQPGSEQDRLRVLALGLMKTALPLAQLCASAATDHATTSGPSRASNSDERCLDTRPPRCGCTRRPD